MGIGKDQVKIQGGSTSSDIASDAASDISSDGSSGDNMGDMEANNKSEVHDPVRQATGRQDGSMVSNQGQARASHGTKGAGVVDKNGSRFSGQSTPRQPGSGSVSNQGGSESSKQDGGPIQEGSGFIDVGD